MITFVRTGMGNIEEFMSYKLSDCIISGYSISSGSDAEPLETISLSYSAIEVSYKDRDAANKAGNVQRVRYDVKAAKAA